MISREWWSGYYFLRHENAVVGLQALISGEYKDVDRFRGKAAEDTGITSLFAGPRLSASLGKVSAEVAVEMPLTIHNTALQAVPDYQSAVRFPFTFKGSAGVADYRHDGGD